VIDDTTLDLTISIVSYNTSDYLSKCLESIYCNTEGISFEVIVVDNASRDGTPDMMRSSFPQARLIVNPQNNFFSQAHNQAFAAARGRYFLILNSDTEIPKGTLKTLVSFMDERRQTGAVSCREIGPAGTLQTTASTFSTPFIEILEWTWLRDRAFRGVLKKYRLEGWPRDTLRTIEVSTDCFLMVRSELFREIGGYDEQFLLYYTENDLCLRIWQAGYRVEFTPDACYVHHVHGSTDREKPKHIRKIYFNDMENYYRKHFGSAKTALMMYGILIGRALQRGLAYMWPPRWLRFARRRLEARFGL
jgi:GT2 family glycosyltransferase